MIVHAKNDFGRSVKATLNVCINCKRNNVRDEDGLEVV
jgi:hypothetical protein